MRTLLRGFLLGILFGLLFVLVVGIQNSRRQQKRDVELSPSSVLPSVEYLAPGAAAWKAFPEPKEVRRLWTLPDGRAAYATGVNDPVRVWNETAQSWEADAGLQAPLPPVRPGIPNTVAFPLGDQGWILAKLDECQLRLEPGPETLPPLPECENAFHQVRSAARLSDGTYLIVLQRKEGNNQVSFHSWSLPPGSRAWKALPAPARPFGLYGSLIPGAKGDALYVPGAGQILLYEAGRWRDLPPQTPERSEQKAVFAANGAVFATGGRPYNAEAWAFPSKLPRNLVLLGFVAACFLVARRKKASFVLTILPGLAGIGLVFAVITVAAYAGWIAFVTGFRFPFF